CYFVVLTCLKHLCRELSYRAQKTITRFILTSFSNYERLVDQITHQVQNIFVENVALGTHRFGGFQRPASAKYGTSRENDSLGCRQKVVAPLDCGTKCPVTRYCSAAASCQEVEDVLKVRTYLCNGQTSNSRRSKLNCQSDTVQITADVG